MKWTVYAAQILTGVAGTGAVLVADNVTQLHVLVAVILAISVVVSLLVVARTEADADRNRSHLDTLLRAMELPYFIIAAVSKVVDAVAKQRGWQLTRQENFKQETVYQFQSTDGQPGRLVVPAQEFKDLWILDEKPRKNAIERRLFAPVESGSFQGSADHADIAVREAISTHLGRPHWVSQVTEADGARRYEVHLDQADRPIKSVVVSKQRFDELLSMLPIRRDHELAEEVGRIFLATP
jgi:hypothetical protein